MRRRVAIFKGNPNRWTHLTARPTCSKEHWQSIGLNDTQADMLPGVPESAICVQRFDDSLNSAIHITYRSWLRSSSMHEPRDPPLKVVIKLLCLTDQHAATAHQPDQTTNVHSVRTDLVHTGFINSSRNNTSRRKAVSGQCRPDTTNTVIAAASRGI